MKKIEISHNPYKTVTTIKMNGKEIGESKFAPYLRERFQLWVDKIPELLIDVFNEDSLEVNFYGTELDYQDLKIELEKAENSGKAKFNLSHKKAKEFGEKEKDIRLIYEEASKLPFDTLKSNALKDAYEKAFDEKVKEVKEQVTKSGEEGLESTKLVAKIFNKVTYKVNKVEENGDNAELDVTIKAVNLGKYMDELSAHLKATASAEPTEEELNKIAVEYFTELLKNEKDLEYSESNVQIQMTKIDGKWEIENAADFYIALYGGQGQVSDLPAQN